MKILTIALIIGMILIFVIPLLVSIEIEITEWIIDPYGNYTVCEKTIEAKWGTSRKFLYISDENGNISKIKADNKMYGTMNIGDTIAQQVTVEHQTYGEKVVIIAGVVGWVLFFVGVVIFLTHLILKLWE